MDNGAQYYYLKMQALLRFSKKKTYSFCFIHRIFVIMG